VARTEERRAGAILAALAVIAGCGGAPPPPAPSPPAAPAPAPAEAPPARDLFAAPAMASLFSYPRPLAVTDAALGPEWRDGSNGTIVWAIAFAADETFAPVTLILFEGPYRGMKLDANVKNLLRTQDAYHDLDYGGGRRGFAMQAAGLGGPLDTATIPSPKGRYELLLVIDVPKGGPKEGKGTEAYRSLLMDYPVKLIEVVAKGIAERWR
jgi:hypothetical protein